MDGENAQAEPFTIAGTAKICNCHNFVFGQNLPLLAFFQQRRAPLRQPWRFVGKPSAAVPEYFVSVWFSYTCNSIK